MVTEQMKLENREISIDITNKFRSEYCEGFNAIDACFHDFNKYAMKIKDKTTLMPALMI